MTDHYLFRAFTRPVSCPPCHLALRSLSKEQDCEHKVIQDFALLKLCLHMEVFCCSVKYFRHSIRKANATWGNTFRDDHLFETIKTFKDTWEKEYCLRTSGMGIRTKTPGHNPPTKPPPGQKPPRTNFVNDKTFLSWISLFLFSSLIKQGLFLLKKLFFIIHSIAFCIKIFHNFAHNSILE